MSKKLLVVITAFCISSCSTPYQERSFMTLTGGYGNERIDDTHYRVGFSGNGHTNYETAQTYWLYRCAELTLEKGYDGFEIESDIRFVKMEGEYEIASSGGGAVYIPTYESYKPSVMGDIKLLRGQVISAPPKVFNAVELKTALTPYVMGKKCGSGNVCPHVKRYLGRN